jgi:hypothetical protein
MSDPIRSALLEALLNCIVPLQLADDEAVDLDLAVAISEDIAATLGRLGPSDRTLLATLIRQLAARETDPARREVLEQTPDALGLLLEDE